MKRIVLIFLVCFSSSVAMKRVHWTADLPEELDRQDTEMLDQNDFDQDDFKQDSPFKQGRVDVEPKSMEDYQKQWKSWRKCAKQFDLFQSNMQDGYTRFYSQELMCGSTVPVGAIGSVCLKHLHNAKDKGAAYIPKLKAQLAGCYKIHLMPFDGDIVPLMNCLLERLKNDAKLRHAIAFFKIMEFTDYFVRKNADGYDPIIVIYPHVSKEMAQYALNALYQLFQHVQGRNVTPRFNEKITSLIYCAQGDSEYKGDNFADYYEPGRVYYRSDFEGFCNDYHLSNPAIKK